MQKLSKFVFDIGLHTKVCDFYKQNICSEHFQNERFIYRPLGLIVFRVWFSHLFHLAHNEIKLIDSFPLYLCKLTSDGAAVKIWETVQFGNRKTKSGALWSMAESISFPPGFLIWLLLRCETTTEPLLLMALLKHKAKSWSFQFTIIDLELSLLVESRDSFHKIKICCVLSYRICMKYWFSLR